MPRKTSRGKNPWIAAILNIILAGLGYIYIGKRKNFGYLLIISQLLIIANYLLNTAAQIPSIEPLSIAGALIVELAFAYDAFTLARE